MEDSNIKIKGKGYSNVDLVFTEGQARVSDSNIILNGDTIEADNVQVSGDIGVEGNIYIGPKGASSPNPSNVYISNGTNIDCNNLNINCQDHTDILIKKGFHKRKKKQIYFAYLYPFIIFARAKVKCAQLWRCFGVEKNKIIHPHGRLLHGKL